MHSDIQSVDPQLIDGEKAKRQRAFVTVSVMLATIMQAIDTTIANVALPHMQGSMGVFQNQISWVLTSYVLAAAIFIPLTGILTQRLGRKRLFLICVVGFTVVSMLCGAAQDIYQIVLFRFLQGIFGAPLVPLSQAVMLDTYPREKIGSAMAMWGMGVMLGPVIGPTLGGFLTEYYSWRWVFYINLPVGILAWIGIATFVKETPLDKERKFDLLGFAFLALSIGALQLMLDRGESLDWFASTEIVIEAFIAVMFFYLFVVHTLTHVSPFIDPILFKDRNFTAGMCFMFLIGIILLAVMALLPPFMQTLLGYPVIDVGYLLAPRGVGVMVSMMVMGRVVDKMDPRIPIVVGLLLVAFSLWEMAQFNDQVRASQIVSTGVVQGIGLGCIFVPLSSLTFATLDPYWRGEATPLYNLVRNLGSSVGISVVMVLLAQNTQINHGGFIDSISLDRFAIKSASENGLIDLSTPAGLMSLDRQVQEQSLLIAYLQDFRFMMWLTLASLPCVLLMRVPKRESATTGEHAVNRESSANPESV